MSLDVRWFTNGKKEVFRIIEKSQTPAYCEIFQNRNDFINGLKNVGVFDYDFTKHNPQLLNWDTAQMFGVLDLLFPECPNCVLPNHQNEKCIGAENCNYSSIAKSDKAGKCNLF